jgi:HPt (histidine-containing phosphotransfer) domain-containing protein
MSAGPMEASLEQQFFGQLSVLGERFAAGVPVMLARLAAAQAAFDPAAPDLALVRDIRAQLHTMAGSAATFGFRALGQQARALEQRLRVLLAFEMVAREDWDAWFGQLERFARWGLRDPKAAYYSEDSVQ